MINQLFFNSEVKPELLDSIKQEQQIYPHYLLPEQDISYLEKYVAQVIANQSQINHIVVVGVGGSSLGAQAVYEFLKPVQIFSKRLHFLQSTNPVDIESILAPIELAKAHFIIASKSGITIEVIAIYKYLLGLVKSANIRTNAFSFISEQDSKLNTYARDIGANYLFIDKAISGRFSVFSAIGLAPLMLLGINIKHLLAGAKQLKNNFFNQGDVQNSLLQKACFYAKNSSHININTIFSYSQSLHYFNLWFMQLWSESLGKQQKHKAVNVGLTPIGLIGPKDQHSFLQLLAQGKHDKTVTFIKLQNFKSKQSVADISLKYLEDFDILNNVSFAKLTNAQADATIAALKSYDDIPIDVINLEYQDAQSIGQLMYYYQLLTSMVGILLDINTYNQPGVELSKKILMNKLKK